eukprot:6175326-Pleurochrysis_carterae.AAC.3
MPQPPPAAQWLQRWEYPPVRRAQRLSYVVSALLPTLDRQRLLAAASVRERLQLCVVHLSRRRARLAAVRAVARSGVSAAACAQGLFFDI